MSVRDAIIKAMKRPKAAVDYGKGTEKEHCGICEHYSNHECSKVIGTINPDMWCKLFEADYG